MKRIKSLMVIMIILITGGFFGYFINDNKVKPQNNYEFQPYNLINIENSDTYKGKYFDNQLNIGFSYPSDRYEIFSLEGTDQDPGSIIYFHSNSSSQPISEILSIIDCEKQNRIESIGMCKESIVSDLDLSLFRLSKEEYEDRISFYNEGETWVCSRDNQSNNEKVVYACLREALGGYPEHSYTVFLHKDGQIFGLSLSTMEPYSQKNLIEAIISTIQ